MNNFCETFYESVCMLGNCQNTWPYPRSPHVTSVSPPFSGVNEWVRIRKKQTTQTPYLYILIPKTGEQAEYAESICWTRSTWYLVDDKENGKELKPEDDEGAMRNMIYYSSQTDQNGYYQTGYVGPHTKVSRVSGGKRVIASRHDSWESMYLLCVY